MDACTSISIATCLGTLLSQLYLLVSLWSSYCRLTSQILAIVRHATEVSASLVRSTLSTGALLHICALEVTVHPLYNHPLPASSWRVRCHVKPVRRRHLYTSGPVHDRILE